MSTLADILTGALGPNPINRPALNAYVAQGQAQAGLRTAETNNALLAAQKSVDEANARQRVAADLQNTKDVNGQPMYTPSESTTLGDELAAAYGNAQQVAAGLRTGQQIGAARILGNPASIGTPAATAAAAEFSGKAAPLTQAVPNEYAVTPGAAPPNVQQTPLGAAQTQAASGHAAAAQAQANRPAATNIPMTPQQIQLRGHLIATGQLPMPASYEWTRNPTQAAAVIQAATAENPNLSAALQPTIQATVKDFSGEGPNGKRLQGYRTVESHLALMPATIAALENGSFTPANAVYQQWQKLTGHAPPTNAALIPQYLSAETMRALSNSGIGTEADRARLQEAWSPSASPSQLSQAVALTKQLLAGGEASMATSYQAGTYGMAGKGWVPSFQQLMTGTVGAPNPAEAAPAAAPGAAPGTPNLAALALAELARRHQGK